ncbi:MAG: L,D-transpeptidase [Thermomicrobiales bacterium]
MSVSSTTSAVRVPGVRRLLSALGVAAIVLALAAPLAIQPAAAQRIDPNWSPPRTIYIPETGHSLDQLFLDLWREAGGANAYGYPITPEITLDNGHIIQYLQYARFEYWPEGGPNGNYVMLGDIGAELRPPVVFRTRGPFGGASSEEANEAAAIARAWLPLGDDASQAITADYRFVPETGHSVRFGFKQLWEATGEAAYLGNPLTEEYVLDDVTYQVFERGQLAWQQGSNPWIVPLGEMLAKRYKLDTSPQPQGDLPTYSEELFIPPVLMPKAGPPPPGGYAKSIVVSISQQSLWAYEGNEVVLSTFISTGKARFDTPTGLFFINAKLPVQDMAGVIGGESYDVPSVPDVMYFTGVGHAIHGTYWHSNFGAPMSHGCINVPLGTSTWLYNWAPSGTPVQIVP